LDGINLHRLQIFRTVYETMSVSGAARTVRLSQPTVSRHLAIFEDELGIELFRNVSGRLEPTWEAQRLYAESGGLFERLGQVEASVESIRRGQQDTLRIMASTALCMSALPEAIGALYRRMPDLEVILDSGRQKGQLAALREGSIDLAVGGGIQNRPDLRQTIIAHLPLVALVPGDHPRAGEEAFDLAWLSESGCVLHNARAPMGRLIAEELERRNIVPQRSIRGLSILSAVGLAQGVNLCLVVDQLTALRMARDMRILPLTEPLLQDLAVIEVANRPIRRSMTAFKEELERQVHRALDKP
jgi:DNA-binding transcriptional LysR family regulator